MEDRATGSILVVDDEVDIRAMVGLALRLAGYDVLEVANGRDALAELKQSPRPGLILLDLRMPVMNGWQFREQQRRDPELAPIPVVVMSGDGNIRAITSEIEASDYLTKPIELDRLLAMVKEHCPTCGP